MKIVISILFMALGLTAHAEDKSSGCGLGWKVAPQNSLISSYTRSSTNASTSSTMGMTSGTSGCDKHSIVKKDMEQLHFAEANFHALMVEMAKGQGEHVRSFAAVLGCEDAQLSKFERMSQQNYQNLFPSEGASPAQLVDGVKVQMRQSGVCTSAAI